MTRAAFAAASDNARKLEPHRIDTNAKWKRVTPSWCYPSRCYERAFAFVSANTTSPPPFAADRFRLVHGVYGPSGGPFFTGHAWVELGDDVVFDGVLQAFYDAAGYRAVYRAEPVKRFTCDQAFGELLKYNHDGPWFRTEDLMQLDGFKDGDRCLVGTELY